MRRIRLARRRLLLLDHSTLAVDYWLLSEDWAGRRWYGIALTDNRGEAVRLPRLSGNRWKVIWLIKRMAKGYVTPLTAKDIVADYLSEEGAWT